MTIKEIADGLHLTVLTPDSDLDREVKGGYVSDLLSDVIGNSREGFVWVTIQVHLNVIAVAALKGLSGIILANDRRPDTETLGKAVKENVVIMASPLPAFDIVGRLYSLGIRCR